MRYAIGGDRVRSELPASNRNADHPRFGGHNRGHQRMVLGRIASVVRWRGVDLRRYSIHADRDHADEQETPRSWTRSRLGSRASALAGLGKTARGSEYSCSRGLGRFSVIGDLALNLTVDWKINSLGSGDESVAGAE